MSDQILVTVKRAQQQLSLGRTKIYDLIDAGDLRAVKIGRACRITAASIKALADRLAQQVAP